MKNPNEISILILFLLLIMISLSMDAVAIDFGESINDISRITKPAGTGVNGSVHDMNMYFAATSDEFGRVCVFCHTPHNSQVDPLAPGELVPLWNHEFSAQNWDPYVWYIPENTLLPITDPLVGPSRLCMSCHDGVVAIDQHGPTRSFSDISSGAVLIGNRAIGRHGDLTDDHPIGFDYTEALALRNFQADGTVLPLGELAEIQQPFATAITPSSVPGVYNTVVRSGTRTIEDVLYHGTIVTCCSCHEVHNRENAIQDLGNNGVTPNFLLYAKEKDSLLCLSCHIK